MNPPNRKAQRRSAARLAAVQILYSLEIAGLPVETALAQGVTGLGGEGVAAAEPDGAMVDFLVRGVVADLAELDRLIGANLAQDWTIERLEALLRAILRAAACELRANPKTPVRVVISEYVDVAHAFYAGPEPGLVNAVLDRLARSLRPSEFA